MPEERQNNIAQEDEIDLILLFNILWLRRIFIVKCAGICLAIGILIALTTPKEYSTSCTLIPEAMDAGKGLGGSLGGLAALAGVDLGNVSGGGANINPGLYRSIAESTPFLLELMNEKFYFSELEKDISLFEYYNEYYKTGIIKKILVSPFKLIRLITGSQESSSQTKIKSTDIVILTAAQQYCANDLKNRIKVTMDWDLSVVEIEVEMQNPVVAAEVARFTQNYITDYVTRYALSKGQEQLAFVQDQLKAKSSEFLAVQLELARFRDQNQYVNTAQAKSEEQRLMSKYDLAFNIYNQLAGQVEKIKLQLNESKPVFTELEPVKVPVSKSSPNWFLIIFAAILFGLAAPIGFVLVQYIAF